MTAGRHSPAGLDTHIRLRVNTTRDTQKKHSHQKILPRLSEIRSKIGSACPYAINQANPKLPHLICRPSNSIVPQLFKDRIRASMLPSYHRNNQPEVQPSQTCLVKPRQWTK